MRQSCSESISIVHHKLKYTMIIFSCTHIRHLEMAQSNIQTRLNTAEEELQRQREFTQFYFSRIADADLNCHFGSV
jgi:glutamine amidotransferase-like uncharacterized protein